MESTANILPSKRQNTVGISVYTGRSNREIQYEPYIQALAALVRFVVEDGYKVAFFPMHLNDRNEHKYFTDIINRAKCEDSCSIIDSNIDTLEHLKKLAECKLFIGHKTHSIIFALVTATPLIAIAYHVKTLDFMRQFGLEEYGVPESEITPQRLQGLYERISKNLDSVHEIEKIKNKEMCDKVEHDFEQLLSDKK